jgi:hypothetical protein
VYQKGLSAQASFDMRRQGFPVAVVRDLEAPSAEDETVTCSEPTGLPCTKIVRLEGTGSICLACGGCAIDVDAARRRKMAAVEQRWIILNLSIPAWLRK